MRGSSVAEHWQRGKRTGRECCGSIECDDPACSVIIRPQTRALKRQDQLAQSCVCGGKLHEISCGVVSWLHTYRDGVHYINGGYHQHPRPTHILHLLPNERVRFERIVIENPSAKPLALVVGRPGLHGPGKSVAEISPALLNADRVKYQRKLVQVDKGIGGKGGDDFVAQFSAFEQVHPGFIQFSQFGPITVIVMQTRYMLSKLLKDRIDREAVNGIVTDAAHGYWSDSKMLLIMSSVYAVDLHCWIPGLITYSNGASEEHYRIHFMALFGSIAEECSRRELTVTDAMFANVSICLYSG